MSALTAVPGMIPLSKILFHYAAVAVGAAGMIDATCRKDYEYEPLFTDHCCWEGSESSSEPRVMIRR